jgi:hypothetical protein
MENAIAATQITFCKSGVCNAKRHILRISPKSFALRDQGHLFFTFTSVEEEMLLAGERQTTNPFRFGAILFGVIHYDQEEKSD